jgi:phage terminase large subunit-like protein
VTTEREIAEAELLRLLQEEADWQSTHKFYDMFPETGPLRRELYPKHLAFFATGNEYQERCFMGGNGSGKTWGVAAYELTCHLTGEYPSWWNGRVFDGPISAWVCGDTRETVRDIIQAKLLGEVSKLGESALGTGMIPRDKIVGEPKYIPNTNKACDFVNVKHASGGISQLGFKAYEQGRKAFQGTEKHVIVLDEEPPYDVYLECLQRGRVVNGMTILTFTPLSGYTEVVNEFVNYEKRNAEGASKILITCGWDDVPHLDEEWKRKTMAATPGYLREARMLGIPTAGIGKVYPIEEDMFVIKPVPIQPHWRRVFGFDHGYFNTACVWMAYDKDTDTVYLYADYKRGEVPIDLHAMAIRSRGDWIPGVGDAAARNGDGEQIIHAYQARGVKMRLPNKSVDAGIQEVHSRLSTGRLKVFNTCQKWLDEFRRYRYDEKQRVVKEHDHLMDATRYAIMSGLAIAKSERQNVLIAPSINFG